MESNRRRHGRIRSKDLTTRLGEILDLSASGMRVLCNSGNPPSVGSVLHLAITHPQAHLPIKAKLVWLKRCGFMRYEAGLVFEDINPSTRAGLTAMARLAIASLAVEYLHGK